MKLSERVLRQGWPAASVGAIIAMGTALWLISTSEAFLWLTSRMALGGLAFYGVGLIFGSERLVAFATVPLLASAVLSVEVDTGIDLGRALIIGCMWYVSTELAWESIGWRSETVRTSAIATQRTQEVATVVVVAIAIGLASVGLASVAPSRTLLLRALAVGAVVAGLAIALYQLNRTQLAPARKSDG